MTASTPLWSPPLERASRSRLAGFLDGNHFGDYDQAWRWSVAPETSATFWSRVIDTFGVELHRPADADLVADPASPTGVRWFPGAQLNYAQHCLARPAGSTDPLAVVARSQTRGDLELSWSDLRSLVARVRNGLVRAGVGSADVVAGYLPNIPEAVAAMLACASLGAVWTCCSPEMGVDGCLERFRQVRPKVLVTVDGYVYGRRRVDRTAESEAIRVGLPSLTAAVWIRYLSSGGEPPVAWTDWADLIGEEGPLDFEPVSFDHPLYVLYSSGTTGKPKAIVHGHGGILLEHLKALGFHFDLRDGDRFFWYTTTGWMMWNFCVSGLLLNAAVVLYDGDPGGPDGGQLWRLMADTSVTCAGVGAGYLVASARAGLSPRRDHDLALLQTLGSTGSALPASAATWVYEQVKDDLLLGSFSGGTDVCTGFVGPSPLHPVWPGEISCRCLGAKVEIHDDRGKPIVGRDGELVLTAPLPSMPVGIVGDTDGSRYRSTYFPTGPGVWVHGDRARLTERATVVITGRSDGTLNRGGVRIGTAEFYSVVEALPQIRDSLVVHVEDPAGGPGELILFVVPTDRPADPGEAEALSDHVRSAIGRGLSPRHQPDEIHVLPSVPRTLSGKKLEVPVKRILSGAQPDHALSLSSVSDPESLGPVLELAARRLSR